MSAVGVIAEVDIEANGLRPPGSAASASVLAGPTHYNPQGHLVAQSEAAAAVIPEDFVFQVFNNVRTF